MFALVKKLKDRRPTGKGLITGSKPSHYPPLLSFPRRRESSLCVFDPFRSGLDARFRGHDGLSPPKPTSFHHSRKKHESQADFTIAPPSRQRSRSDKHDRVPLIL